MKLRLREIKSRGHDRKYQMRNTEKHNRVTGKQVMYLIMQRRTAELSLEKARGENQRGLRKQRQQK